jgi:hypothetical protein
MGSNETEASASTQVGSSRRQRMQTTFPTANVRWGIDTSAAVSRSAWSAARRCAARWGHVSRVVPSSPFFRVSDGLDLGAATLKQPRRLHANLALVRPGNRQLGRRRSRPQPSREGICGRRDAPGPARQARSLLRIISSQCGRCWPECGTASKLAGPPGEVAERLKALAC